MTQLLTKTKSKVLVIDDSLMARKLIISYLNTGDYEIYESKTGREGLAVAAEVHPDLILLDFVMPGMNGYDVYQALRSQSEFQSTPVILFSSSYDEVVKKFGFPFEGFEFLHKHATNQQVLSCIESLLPDTHSDSDLDTAPMAQTLTGEIQALRQSLAASLDEDPGASADLSSESLPGDQLGVDNDEADPYHGHKSNDIADALAALDQPQTAEPPTSLASPDSAMPADSFSINADPAQSDSVQPEMEPETGIEYSEVSTSHEDLSRKVVQTAIELADHSTVIRTLERKLEGLTLQIDQVESRLDKYTSRERPTPSLWTWLILVTLISAVVGTLTGSLLLRSLEQSPSQNSVPEAPLPINPGQ